ncbi:MAG: DNA polymerase IV [Eubacteriales bacterium]|nr:DNA polymerase IV [Eubacteriales bacterium]
MDRIVLHSDMNSFYASVELMLHPELRGRPMAICGSEKERHGIVLAKTDEAKKFGIKTGMPATDARNACPDIILRAPNYPQYVKYSKSAREIYGRYTDYIEPFGMDECWLDLTRSNLKKSGPETADEIRETIHRELGITVSIGVSFNKIFAKLGSDMKKPDAVTVITRDNFKERVWPLPVGDLLYAGHATVKKLNNIGVKTIGELANADPYIIKKLLGVNGTKLQSYALGTDESRVMHKDCIIPPKSIGHGVTCVRDLSDPEEIRRVILELSQDIGTKLREERAFCNNVSVVVRGSDLNFEGTGTPLMQATRSPAVIANAAFLLFKDRLMGHGTVRAITITVFNLTGEDYGYQPNIFIDQTRVSRRDKAEDAIEEIRKRFGKEAVIPASLLLEDAIPHDGRHLVKMPNPMYA